VGTSSSEMAIMRSLRAPALNRAIQDQIKQYITERRLRPGDALPPETQLAADLGVSRSSVREAIKALESLGIVEVRHGNGIFVREFNFDSVLELLSYGLVFDPSKIAEILQIRKWLEAAAIGEAVRLITDSQITHIVGVLEHWEKKAAAGEPTAEEDRAFHRLLYEPLGNQALISLLDTFWLVFHAVPVRAITTDMQPTTTVQDHWDILDAVRRRDPALARQRIQDHFRNLEGRIAQAGLQSTAAGLPIQAGTAATS
jgi:DNA-binding FadR family transcriptional regulator